MGNISVHRYPAGTGRVLEDGSMKRRWDGWIEPDDKSWIAFVDVRGKATFFLERDANGGIVTP